MGFTKLGHRCSAQETLAGLLPAAGRAPQLPLLDAVNSPALFGVATEPPAR